MASADPVEGVVVDTSGAPVPGASVTLKTRSGVRETQTDGTGRFQFEEGAPQGILTVSLYGFDEATTPASSSTRVELHLAALNEQVTVTADVAGVATATKTPTVLRDVPQAVSIVSREVIASQGMQGMTDVVRYMPGVGMAQGEGNRDTPILRGNNTTSDFFVDGVRDDVQYVRDLYNVERVEALKGPNAMIFGRGGAGGVINRVSRQADWQTAREVVLQTGSWDNRRVTTDLGHVLSRSVAGRVAALYEDSGTYRDGVGIRRYGFNPSLGFELGRSTLRVNYELFHDERTADRGVPSFQGRPLPTATSAFFGNPDDSTSDVTVHALNVGLDHRLARQTTLRAKVRYADYDKFYRNVFPGAVGADGSTVAISAYQNGTDRRNLFAQADLVSIRRTGALEHTLLVGAEAGRQVTDNLRKTGYFGSATALNVPVSAASITTVPDYRPSATDADNHGVATVAAIYAQDQVKVSRHLQLVAGLRYDRFAVEFDNHRTQVPVETTDGLVSPRLGVIVKPAEPVSIYASYSLSYLPRAGEQLSSLSPTVSALEPEDFRNTEIGLKWDLRPSLALTLAAYRLDRGNVAVADPTNPSVTHLVDGQRTDGFEASLGGHVTPRWSVLGGYAWQDGRILQSLSATAPAGARLAQVPKHSYSLWNRFDPSPRYGVGVGVVRRADVFTSTDNTVTLPAYTRVDAAGFLTLGKGVLAQVNLENALGTTYWAFSNGNNNITPGSPRGVRVALTTRF